PPISPTADPPITLTIWDEVVRWLGTPAAGDESEKEDLVLDDSELDDAEFWIESGVTSGADSNGWQRDDD
ncbi:MAG TPA: hypothetical protein VM308_05270, partial [Sphingomicrobium sp.]|nr:hypothetical protein [Sphingomicrobium sp.]